MRWILSAICFLAYMFGSVTVMGASVELPIGARIIGHKDYVRMKARANVVDGVCDMQRNPDSPECLELIEPAAGEVDNQVDNVTVDEQGVWNYE